MTTTLEHASSLPTTLVDPVSAPAIIRDPLDQSSHHLKVDIVCRTKSKLFVLGWTTSAISLGVSIGNKIVTTHRVSMARPDVAAHFGLTQDEVGFVLVADYLPNRKISLVWTFDNKRYESSSPFQNITDFPAADNPQRKLLSTAIPVAASTIAPLSQEWRGLVKDLPNSAAKPGTARGYIEAVSVCALTNQAIVVGWSVNAPGVVIWLEDDLGNIFNLNSSYRRFRQDVQDAVGHEFAHASGDAGFIARIEGVRPGARISLKALSADGVHHIGAMGSNPLSSDPLTAARWIFSLGTPISELHNRIAVVDGPILSPLIEAKAAAHSTLPITERKLGNSPGKPKVSIIVPLYGRADFVEHQLMEFVRDDWLLQNAEVIYVIDDPKLVESFRSDAESLFRLYQVPFKWLWGSVNRGYSAANNLGAQHAIGEKFLFLNSDAFPKSPGWLKKLCDQLDKNPKVGAVAPRLLFADGSIQHAGMEFRRREELGIWVNHHPNMGLAEELDPLKEPTMVPGVTGACLLMRKKDFIKVRGWDTGYLIGDFEDSDICMKLKHHGLKSQYYPDVQLVHLERQSFKLLGHDEFRTRVVIFNAVRHQNRWESYFSNTES